MSKASPSPERIALNNMIARCHNEKNRSYPDYGGRGIKVCDDWRFGKNGRPRTEAFLADMGAKPSAAHTVERIDNDGNYELTNCRWATRKEQGNNKRNNTYLAVNGEIITLAECSKRFGVRQDTILARIRHGWTVGAAVTTPTNTAGTGRYEKKTHCNRGHPMSGDNLYLPKAGGRQCRKCKSLQSAARAANRSIKTTPVGE